MALVIVLSVGTTTATDVDGDGPPPCPTTAFVEGIGPACEQANGLIAFFDGDGNKLGVTHGPDPAPARESSSGEGSFAEGGGLPAWSPDAPVCDEDGPPHFQLLFVHATDTRDMTGEIRAEIEEEVGRANAFLKGESSEASPEFVVHCEDGALDVPVVQLPVPDSEVTFSVILDHLASEGYDETDVKYWIVYSGWGASSFGGFGNLRGDDDQQLLNDNNDDEPMYAVTFEPFASDWDDRFGHTMLHEASHTMGAVQWTAPNFYDNRGGWHCADETDVMCYGEETFVACGDREHFDCGQDDYFDPRPEPGSYLADSWNIAHPYNRFLEGCMRVEGTLTIESPAPGGQGSDDATVPVASQDTVEVPPGCQGAPFALWGTVPNEVVFQITDPRDTDPLQVCWYAEPPTEGTAIGPLFLGEPSPEDPLPLREAIRCDTTERDAPTLLVLTATGVIPDDARSATVSSVGAWSLGDALTYTLKAT